MVKYVIANLVMICQTEQGLLFAIWIFGYFSILTNIFGNSNRHFCIWTNMLVANTATHYLARIVSETEQNLAKISPVKTMKPSLGLQLDLQSNPRKHHD